MTQERAAATAAGSKNAYTVATDTSFVPFEFQEEEGGEYVGFDIDIIDDDRGPRRFRDRARDHQLRWHHSRHADGYLRHRDRGHRRSPTSAAQPSTSRARITNRVCASACPRTMTRSRASTISRERPSRPASDRRARTTSKTTSRAPTPNTYEQLDQAYLAVEGDGADAVLYDAAERRVLHSHCGRGQAEDGRRADRSSGLRHRGGARATKSS